MQYAAANIRRLRRLRALTQEDLAAASGLDVTYLARVERATINLSIGVLAVLADALGVEPGKLLRPARMHVIAMGRPKKKR
jgi:transcriptional regulator with XRE-family HTH domain